VFLAFLYQRYLYPTDKTRANEYGLAYETDVETFTTGEAAVFDQIADLSEVAGMACKPVDEVADIVSDIVADIVSDVVTGSVSNIVTDETGTIAHCHTEPLNLSENGFMQCPLENSLVGRSIHSTEAAEGNGAI
jgi:hypothetical protein